MVGAWPTVESTARLQIRHFIVCCRIESFSKSRAAVIFFSRLEFVPAQINGQKNTIAARDRGLWVGCCTAVLLYCCTEIPVRCRQIQYVLHLSTPHLRTWYGFFFSLCPWRRKSSLTEDGRGPLAPARPEPLFIIIIDVIRTLLGTARF